MGITGANLGFAGGGSAEEREAKFENAPGSLNTNMSYLENGRTDTQASAAASTHQTQAFPLTKPPPTSRNANTHAGSTIHATIHHSCCHPSTRTGVDAMQCTCKSPASRARLSTKPRAEYSSGGLTASALFWSLSRAAPRGAHGDDGGGTQRESEEMREKARGFESDCI
ncbi:hypothetical protein BDN70DRAFT_920414 [Pholiota conissans]|uniref:Uncharacterized protein n=1 Tax=Pholiota conissans TaxID=109636 RepID=A0A9P5Z5S1_9AGAR|nr:hypothetical protein BDN70DRAFT_920414 [Pholiota conissans]